MPKQVRLSQLQLRIMHILWERGRATAREITEEMAKAAPIAHSTVQTLLRRMEKKGTVNHVREGRTFVFVPAVEQEDVQQSAFRDLFEGIFRDSASLLVAHLIENEPLSKDELHNLRKLIDSKTREEDK